jgi:hypothetical protein
LFLAACAAWGLFGRLPVMVPAECRLSRTPDGLKAVLELPPDAIGRVAPGQAAYVSAERGSNAAGVRFSGEITGITGRRARVSLTGAAQRPSGNSLGSTACSASVLVGRTPPFRALLSSSP